jgi:hypothetical protein
MLATLIFTAALASLPARESTSTPFSGLPGLTSQLCFERREDDGSMNGHPSTVGVYTKLGGAIPNYSVTLSGGQAACVFVTPGTYTILVSSNQFIGPIGDAPSIPNTQKCRSRPFHTNLKAKERITLSVRPARSAANGGGYSDCGWVIQPRGTSPNKSSKRTRVPRAA